jgi:hypothetical protein
VFAIRRCPFCFEVAGPSLLVTRTRVTIKGNDRMIVGDEKITMTRDEHAMIGEDDNGMRLIMSSVVEQQWVGTTPQTSKWMVTALAEVSFSETHYD